PVFFESTRALGVGRAMTISTTYPVGAAAIAAVFLDEPVTLPIAVGTLVTLAGLALIVAPWAERAPEERFWFGVGTAALASLAWAVSTVLVKPPLSEKDAVTAQAIRLPLPASAPSPSPEAPASTTDAALTAGPPALVPRSAGGVGVGLRDPFPSSGDGRCGPGWSPAAQEQRTRAAWSRDPYPRAPG